MTSAEALAMYRRQLEQNGETVTIRRYTGTGETRPHVDWPVTARVKGYQPQELLAGIDQGDVNVIVLADDLDGSTITEPLVKGDSVIIRGRERAIMAVDDNTRRIGATLIAYDLQCRG
jgi:hypothetical protein